MDLYAVVGHPISHSLSPRIHGLFAEQTQQTLEYTAQQLDLNLFETQLRGLISNGYKGVNVTVPFKQQAWELCDRLSPRARDASAVNTLIFQQDGLIAGDNTDGIGMIRDLIVNNSVLIEHRKILVLGAGGAVRGVLGPLLSKKPGLLTVANRTLTTAQQLAKDLAHLGEINVSAYQDLKNEKYDLIINGTSTGLNNEIPPVPDEVLGINSVCYDMMYNISEATAFTQWALDRGALRAFDGLGMLVEQAAESFYIWRGIRPLTKPVIEALRDTAE